MVGEPDVDEVEVAPCVGSSRYYLKLMALDQMRMQTEPKSNILHITLHMVQKREVKDKKNKNLNQSGISYVCLLHHFKE